jgi:hypothetical protein
MSVPRPILAQVRAILARDADADRMALVWPDPITPAVAVQRVDGTELRFVWCASELAMRELLVAHPGEGAAGGPRLVLLTPLDERRLARDVLARLWGYSPKRISAWRTLEQLLHLREIDPRLTTKDYRWVSECLLDQYDRYRDRVQFGDVLDFDLAWRALATALLELDGENLDLDVLLDWSQRADAVALVAALPEPVDRHLKDWLRPRLGDQAQVVLALWRNGQAGGMLAIGLVCALLYGQDRRPSRQTMSALLLARGRFSERLLGGAAIAESTLAGFGRLVVAHLERSLAAQPGLDIGPVLDAAEQLLDSLDLTHLAADSDLLPKGYALRLDAFTKVLDQALEQGLKPSPKRPDYAKAMGAALEALARLERHRLANQRDGARAQQLETARMAVRACQWLITDAPNDATPAAAIQAYVVHGGWLDWARTKLWRGDAHEPLSRVYRRLSAQLAERREAFNRSFSRHLPAIARGDQIADWVAPIEDALSDWVAPLAAKRPVLLVVLDGMSQAVYRELSDDLLRHQWVEIQPLEAAADSCLLAVLPTITRLSRYALLSGSLGEGTQDAEKKAFAAHAALKAVSTAKAPPRLFHKADLTEPGSGALAGTVRAAIAAEQPKVIGVVVNAIDDQLSSNAQLGVPWSLASLAVLRQLLEAARESGRLVIMTSDHGHVLDHDMRLAQTATGAERYRSATELSQGSEPAPEEVLVEGRRVALPDQRAVLPWSERLRYGAQKMGYHGGGAPQEVLVPFGVFRSAGDAQSLEGWQEVPRREPVWWRLDAGVSMGESSAAEAAASPASIEVPGTGQFALDLAGEKPAARAGATGDRAWIDALLASPVYARMKDRGGRVPITDEQLRSLLTLLAQGGGQRMMDPLAQGLGIPSIRLPGLLAGVQKRLNLDGYPVLSVDRATKTVRLDIASLRVQFEID